MKDDVYRGLQFHDGLFLLFLGLKLAGSIDWSWWFVFAPLWGWFLIRLGVGVFKATRGGHE